MSIKEGSSETLATGQPSQIVHGLDSYVTLYWQYKIGETPVDVDEGTAIAIFSLNGGVVSPSIMVPVGKEDPGEVGKYSVSFLTGGLSVGTYDIAITGQYQGEEIAVTSSFKVVEVPTVQSMINMVRLSLNDHDSSLYLGLSRQRHWSNPDLDNALRRSLDFLCTCPPNLQRWTFDDFATGGNLEAFQVFLFTLAKYYALMDRVTLESFNAVTINDEVSVTINYAQSIQSLATAIEKVKQEAMTAKRMRCFAVTGPKSLASTRWPWIMTRIWGLLPSSQRIYLPGGGATVDIGYRNF